ncbi:PIN-like domain-containing protein [Bacillus subtilis]
MITFHYEFEVNDLLNDFKGLMGFTETEYKQIWENAVFVVDTNVLINFYKYTSRESTQSLLNILKTLKESDRLWIPHQVALEYFFNYEENMNKQQEGYKYLHTELKKLKNEAEKVLRIAKSHHPYIHTEKFNFYTENLNKLNTELDSVLSEEISNLSNPEDIKTDLINLLAGVVGDPYDQEKINQIEKKGQERYKYDIPPGFEDKNDSAKQGFRNYGSFRYQQLYGDLIMWHQIIDKVKNDFKKPIIFITEEKKKDWWEKEGDKIKKPHPQLVQEFINETNQLFYMYRTESFVKFAKEYIHVDITDEEVQNVTKDVEHIRTFEEENEETNKTNERLKKLPLNEDLPNLKKIARFIPINKLDEYRKKISEAKNKNELLDIGLWGIRQGRPEIESTILDLLERLALIDIEQAKNHYSELKDVIDKKGTVNDLILYNYIDKIENELDSNDNSPKFILK